MYVAQERDKNKNTSSPKAFGVTGKQFSHACKKPSGKLPLVPTGPSGPALLAHSGREVETCAAAETHGFYIRILKEST